MKNNTELESNNATDSCHSQKLSEELEGFVIIGVLRSVSCLSNVNLWGSRLDLHPGTMLPIQTGQLIGRGTSAIFCQNHRLCQLIRQIRIVSAQRSCNFYLQGKNMYSSSLSHAFHFICNLHFF